MGSSNVGDGIVRPDTIAHFGIRTTPEKFEEMVDWHLKFFGGTVVLRTPNSAFIRWDHEHHRLVILAFPHYEKVEDKSKATNVYHLAFSLNSLADLATSYEQKKALGIIPHWPVNHGMSTSMYYFDPDGNEFELQVDNFATAEEAHAFMSTEEYAINPIGVDYVPEELVKRVRSGESEESIKTRPVIGKRLTRWENSIFFKPEDMVKPPKAPSATPAAA